jgi:Beta-lactamase
MFSRVELSHRILIQSVLHETKIESESYIYSNFGYCLLGRVIEKVTKKPFIDYIREKFKVDVRVAGGPASKLQPTETYYYSQN